MLSLHSKPSSRRHIALRVGGFLGLHLLSLEFVVNYNLSSVPLLPLLNSADLKKKIRLEAIRSSLNLLKTPIFERWYRDAC